MRGLAVVLVALALAGCLEGATQQPAPSTGEATYRFIEVTRIFRADPDGTAGVCGFSPPPNVDEDAQTVTFHNDWPGTEYKALILTVTWDRARCGVAHTTWATSHQWSGTMRSGDETLEMADDGTLHVNGEPLPRGGETTYARTGVFEDGRAWAMSTTIRDHGEWPLSGVTLAG